MDKSSQTTGQHRESALQGELRRRIARTARGAMEMPINKTTTIQARISVQEKRFLKQYAESQGITLSELLRRSATALIQIIKAQQK